MVEATKLRELLKGEWLSAQEAGSILGVSHETVKNWAKSGKLRAYKPGQRWRFRPQDVVALLEQSAVA